MDTPPPAHSNSAAVKPPMQRLRWDFRTSFPSPLTQAIDAGVIAPEDCEPENVRRIHDEHAREMLAVLHDLDVAMDIRRRGVDPQTGRMPTTHAGRERLRKTAEEPPRLERSYANLLAVYEEAFGQEAAESFDKALRARRGGVDVVSGDCSSTASASPTPARTATIKATRRRPHRASLPVPRPLASAVAASEFGIDEQGKPIHPTADEVHVITTLHADKLIELLEGLTSADPSTQDKILRQYCAGIAAYAESFGDHAAQRLAAYVQHRADPESRRWLNRAGVEQGQGAGR